MKWTKRTLALVFLMVAFSFSAPATGKWTWAVTVVDGYNPAWNVSGTLIDMSTEEFRGTPMFGNKACHYVGQITLPVEASGDCPDITIRHLISAKAHWDNRTITGLDCEYDNWSIDNTRETCPDIIVSTYKGKPRVIGEYFFKKLENQAIHYQDGRPRLPQFMETSPEIFHRFGKVYENQVRYRDSYDWVRMRPGYNWDMWRKSDSNDTWIPGRNH